MNDDLLRALGRGQRAELDREPEFDELDELARRYDQDERASILDAVFDRVEAPTEDASPPKVIELASRRRLIVSGAVVAAAAALALALWAAPNPTPHDPGPLAVVPPYTITQLSGGFAHQRSEPATDPAASELTLHADSTIDWVLTPAEPTDTALALALLARSDLGDTHFTAPLDAEISSSGAVRLRGPLNRHVELEAGSWSLTLLIAEADDLPSPAAATWKLASGHPGPWRSVTIRVIIVADE